MLAGVLLHVVKAAGPVDLPGEVFANFHRVFDSVENYAVFFMDIGDGKAPQRAVVGGLSTAFGVKGGPVQRHQIPAFARFTGENGGGEGAQEGVLIIELFRFHVEHSFHL